MKWQDRVALLEKAADLIRYSCYQMEKNNGFIAEMGRDPLPGYTATNLSVMHPYGVWLVISPFNFPFAITGGPAGAALATGNTIVIKPATDTSWIVRLFAECRRPLLSAALHARADPDTDQIRGH
jgi:1-pyrroline-5-carboxylate dehydrogenase